MSSAPLGFELSGIALCALRGAERAPPPWAGRPDLKERLASGAPDALAEAWACAHLESMPARVASAIDADRARVALHDGSALPRDEAERVLANKEQRRVFVPLRAPLDALDARMHRGAAAGFERALQALEVPRAGEPGGPVELKEIAALVRGLDEAAEPAAAGLLAELGGVPLESEAAWMRALDLPDESGAYSEERALAAVKSAREAASPVLSRALKQVAIPAALAGCAFDDGGPTVRWGFCGARRAHRSFRLLEGGMRALAWAQGQPRSDADAAMRGLLGRAAALAMVAEPARRFVFGEGRDAARIVRCERARLIARAAIAGRLLAARLEYPEEPEAAHEALAKGLGRVVEGVLAEAGAPPWPGPGALGGASSKLLGESMGLAHALAVDAGMRARFDELWPMRSQAWVWLAEVLLPEAHEGPARLLEALVGSAPDPAKTLSEWLFTC